METPWIIREKIGDSQEGAVQSEGKREKVVQSWKALTGRCDKKGDVE